MVVIVDRSNNLGVVGYLDSQRCASVESLMGRQHAGVAVMERSQLQRILVGLGTAVHQEQLVVLIARDTSQSLCQLRLQSVLHRVGIEANLLKLFRHLINIMGV